MSTTIYLSIAKLWTQKAFIDTVPRWKSRPTISAMLIYVTLFGNARFDDVEVIV